MQTFHIYLHLYHLTLHLCGLFQVKYKEKYEKEKGKAMLDFETPTYMTAKEAQHMQSQVNTLSPLGLKLLQMQYTSHYKPLSLSQSEDSSVPAIRILTCIVMPLVIYIDMLQFIGCPAIVYIRLTECF